MRRISATGIVATLIGDETTDTFFNVPATSTGLFYPTGVTVDPGNGNVIVSSRSGSQVIIFTPAMGLVTLVAGSPTQMAGDGGDKGPATSAILTGPDGLYLEFGGNLIIASYNYHKVRWVYSTSPTATPSKMPTMVPSVSPTLKPTAAPSSLPTAIPSISVVPTRVPTTSCPTVAPTTSAPSTVRSTINNIDTIAGTGSGSSTGTGGKATSATVYNPHSVFQDTLSKIYVVETDAGCVRRFPTSSMIIAEFAGICNAGGYSGDGGKASIANMNTPFEIVSDTNGYIYISDMANNNVRYVNQFTNIQLYAGAGSGSNTGDGGVATSANLYTPMGMFMTTTGDLYVLCDVKLRKVSGGKIFWVAGE